MAAMPAAICACQQVSDSQSHCIAHGRNAVVLRHHSRCGLGLSRLEQRQCRDERLPAAGRPTPPAAAR